MARVSRRARTGALTLVTVLWATVLQIFGYQYFTQKSIVTAAMVVLGPLAVIVLITSIFALT